MDVINRPAKFFFSLFLLSFTVLQVQAQDSTKVYKKRVLESAEIDILSSYYTQDGSHAAVTGGRGTEKLSDFSPTLVVSVPLNEDDVLSINTGISAYSSASSSNINPFDGQATADAFQASSGASSSDVWWNLNGTYTHSSDDRNRIWSANASVATEYDYLSMGLGGAYAWLFNEKNTELSVKANVFLDTWSTIYPIELRPFAPGGNGLQNSLFKRYALSENADYSPSFTPFDNKSRNSFSIGLGFSQILSENLQTSLELDLVQQQGLLSTPFQRVYFQDVEDVFIGDFQLADNIERLPETRFKVALGGRLNYFANARVVVRTFYRYYFDDWGIGSHTAKIEVPVKISDRFTLYPSYRFYNQTGADYFAPYEQHLSSEGFYTSDYDLSQFNANQYGFGISYTDIFTRLHLWSFGLKNIDLRYLLYQRNIGFTANTVSAGLKFVLE